MILRKNTDLSTAYLQVNSSFLWVINILIILCFLSSCSSSSPRAPISSRNQPPSTKVVEHLVAPGETLYSIAWRYGLDYKGLARANGIDATYRIFPGQIIYLTDNAPPKMEPKVAVLPIVVPPSVVAKPPPVVTPKIKETVKPPPVIERKPVDVARAEKKSIPVVKEAPSVADNHTIFWRWPAKGKVITNFHGNNAIKKGIDIAGKKGESVNAAASGEVVYAGSGLRGYGKLVIIKHSDVYLSAYAHNHRLRVKEGDKVTSGQHIADIGSSGVGVKGKPRLHFQIRQDGKPIDPLPLLPKRNF